MKETCSSAEMARAPISGMLCAHFSVLEHNCNMREGQMKVLLGIQPELSTLVTFRDHKQDSRCSGRESNEGKPIL